MCSKHPNFLLGLTEQLSETHPAEGDDAGDLQSPAALRAHQAVSGLQAARGTAALRAVVVRFLRVSPGLSLPRVRVLLVPLLALAFSHDARFRSVKKTARIELCGLPHPKVLQ